MSVNVRSYVRTSLPYISHKKSKVFSTLEAFNEGYAGPHTRSLEKKSRDLAGRQDDFCIICGNHADQLYPQTRPGEIHLCPRQLCSGCWHIEAGWKRDSPTKRRSLKVDDGRNFVAVCCPLCWKRGWDFSSPLLGPNQPEWSKDSGLSTPPQTDALLQRYKNWEEAARTKVFSWRKPLLTSPDDMTLESDRNLLRDMLKKFQKNPKRFKLFDEHVVVEATVEDSQFDIADAFNEHCQHFMEMNFSSDEEVVEEPPVKVKRGPGRPPKKKKTRPSWYMVEEPVQSKNDGPIPAIASAEKSATPDISGRPKRQAARLSFASGVPVQRDTALDKGSPSEEPEAPRSLKSRARKIVILPVSLPASPETNKDVTGPRFALQPVLSSSPVDTIRTENSPIDMQNNAQSLSTAAVQEPISNGRLIQPPAAEKNLPILQNGIAAPHEAPTDHNALHAVNIPNDSDVQVDASDALPEQQTPVDDVLADLQAKYTMLEQEHDLLNTKYKRWRSGVVENSKLIFDQEQDLTAKKDIITASNKTIKQLSSDNARLGAELALARGMVQYNPALLRQSFLRGSLTPDIVERLFTNPDFIALMAPRPANGEVGNFPSPIPGPVYAAPAPAAPAAPAVTAAPAAVAPAPTPDSAPRPKKRRRITASDPDAEEARQKKLSRVIAPTIKRLEKSRFKLSASEIEQIFDADTAESKRFLDSLIDFAKLPINFDEALTFITEAQQDRRQGRVIVPQLRLSDPTWAPWDVKTAQKRYMARNGMSENDAGEIVTRKPKSMEEMVADARAVREAVAKVQRRDTIETNLGLDESTMLSENDSPTGPATEHTRTASSSRRGGRSESEFRRVWERHEELRREREHREMAEQRAREPPLDMTDPLQALAASMFTSVNGGGSKGKGRAGGGWASGMMNGNTGGYMRRDPQEEDEYMEGEDEEDEPMDVSESP